MKLSLLELGIQRLCHTASALLAGSLIVANVAKPFADQRPHKHDSQTIDDASYVKY